MMLVSNAITGEMAVANVKVDVRVSKDLPKLRGEPFTMLFQKLGAVTAKNIKPVTAKVLIYLCAVVDYGNVVNKGSDQIAKELGYSIRNIQRALLELEEMKIIIRDKNATDGRWVMIYLNPYHSWKGKVIERKKKIAGYHPDQLEMFPPDQAQHSLLSMSPKTLEDVSVANANKK